jgi:hypothetical protein
MTTWKSILKPAAVGLLLFLAACNPTAEICALTQDCGASSPPVDAPGTYSLYSVVDFTNGDEFPSLCVGFSNTSTYAQCFYDYQNNLGADLSSAGWSGSTTTDGYINGAWTTTPIQESTIQNTRSNLLFIGSHGSVDPGQAVVCLRNCDDGNTVGSTYSFEPSEVPSWNGPNWLLLDGCSDVQQGVGWENTFGGSLHGILGWNNAVWGLDTSDAAQATFVRLIKGYDTALDAWDQATAATDSSIYASALIPAANAADDIEAAGGPHFGPNGSTNPQYYTRVNDGKLSVTSTATLPSVPASVYSLTPEAMNESYWESEYGGSSVPSTLTHPTANEDLYRNPYVYVDHYLASGGLIAATASTGTAQGFSEVDAYNYALSWINQNGGLPADAVLTFAGPETISPTSTAPTSDRPYPNTRQYIFVWRHGSSGLLSNDKIEIHIDDAGAYTKYQKYITILSPHCMCDIQELITYYAAPWVPVYHMHIYVREWRSIGGVLRSFQVENTGGATSYALCGSDISATTSEATPCGVTTTASGSRILIDLSSGMRTSEVER